LGGPGGLIEDWRKERGENKNPEKEAGEERPGWPLKVENRYFGETLGYRGKIQKGQKNPWKTAKLKEPILEPQN